MSIIGQSIPRFDAYEKVTGKAQFPADINLPNQTYMKILFANRPHAIVHRIDIQQAKAYPGVIDILTAPDVPVNEYGLGIYDQPVLCGPGSPKPFTDRVRFIGDQVAVVIAESEEAAEAARELIQVDYEDLPIVTDPDEAMKDNSILLHPDRESNVLTHLRIRKGDIEQGFSQADVIVESEYITPMQEHAYLQPEAGIAYIDENEVVTVIASGQWAHKEQQQIAHALDLPLEKVRVIHPAIGGAFGGREDISIQIVLALAAVKLHQRGIKRPVKIIWTRQESIIGHHKRHLFKFRTRWGATKDGKLTAAEVEIIQDAGAYNYTSNKVLGNATLMCTGPYEIPNVKVDSYSVYTNNIPGGAFRGFGGPQGNFCAEMQMNKLANLLGLDPVEFRMRNIVKEGSIISVGTPLPEGVTIAPVVEACALQAGWKKTDKGWVRPNATDDLPWITLKPDSQNSAIKRGIGFACGFKNIGFSYGAPEECWATIELHGKTEIEKVVLRHAAAEVGQGSHTVLRQFAAEAVGVPIDKVEAIFADTAETNNSGSVSASRMTFMAGNSIIGAAKLALEKWRDEERPAIGTYQYKPPRTTPLDPETGYSNPNFAYGYMAVVAAVEVDTETGHVKVLDVISTNDVGKAINPQQVEGQIEGAIVQAYGYTVLENFIQKNGYVLTDRFATYLTPSILDIPEKVHINILEYPAPIGPYGARGIGEMPYLPLPAAVISAVQDACGTWFNEFPLTPDRVLLGLRKHHPVR